MQFLIEISYFTVGIPMGIYPAPFWANLYLYNYESKYITNSIRINKLKGRRFYSTFQFIDNLGALNDGGEKWNRIDKGKFMYKMFDKQDTFNFHFARMPSITSNIPSIIFYSSNMSEFVRITRSTLLLKDFLHVAKNLLDQMISQGGSKLLEKFKKALNKHLEAFQEYHIMAST